MRGVIEILKNIGAIITDSHIVGTSGRHMAVYINKDALYPHTQETSKIGRIFAQKHKNMAIEVVVGPAMGAIILSQWTAYHLSQILGKEVLGVYTDKTESGGQILKRGYDKLVEGKNVLVVEDVTTTGGSVKKVVETVKAAGGKVVSVSVMVNRDPKLVTEQAVGAAFSPLAVFEIESFDAAACPLCQQNVPINTSVGHGKQFLEERAKSKAV